ncbi:TraR/DksA family transcriptional regulator [Streptomyces sp. NPDC006463]|uniref:TraR/DksA family transcriptional regulator n=1 Tax=Streptomyces sp. NPDC006463 TaxID=3364746 RepID=UPI0036C5858D
MVAKKTAGTAGKALAEAPAKKAPTGRAGAAGATPVDAVPAGKATAGRAATKKASTKKATTKKATTTKATATKTATATATATAKATAEKATAKKATDAVRATAVKKTTAVAKRQATAKPAGAEGAAQAAKKTGVRKVVAKKSTGTARKTAAAATSGLPKVRVTAATAPGDLAVRPGEDPWTPTEVDEARSELMSEVLRLRAELDASEVAISGLMRDSGDGAGDDQADTGTKNITRESELALAANATSMLEQTERALERLEAGTYGLCENCGQPIGKARMQAFPRATLCVDCKQKQERRH